MGVMRLRFCPPTPTSREAGHAVPDWLYTVALILVILAALHYLGVRW
jgi:hypothetical protein